MEFLKSSGFLALTSLVLIMTSLTAEAHPRFRLVCGANGTNIQPYDQINDVLIGKEGYGYAQVEDCRDALQATEETLEPVVCNWNGINFQPYHILTNAGIGREYFGFAVGRDCNDAVRAARRNVICNWNGSGFQMYNITTNQSIGRVGVTTLQECVQMIHP